MDNQTLDEVPGVIGDGAALGGCTGSMEVIELVARKILGDTEDVVQDVVGSGEGEVVSVIADL